MNFRSCDFSSARGGGREGEKGGGAVGDAPAVEKYQTGICVHPTSPQLHCGCWMTKPPQYAPQSLRTFPRNRLKNRMKSGRVRVFLQTRDILKTCNEAEWSDIEGKLLTHIQNLASFWIKIVFLGWSLRTDSYRVQRAQRQITLITLFPRPVPVETMARVVRLWAWLSILRRGSPLIHTRAMFTACSDSHRDTLTHLSFSKSHYCIFGGLCDSDHLVLPPDNTAPSLSHSFIIYLFGPGADLVRNNASGSSENHHFLWFFRIKSTHDM